MSIIFQSTFYRWYLYDFAFLHTNSCNFSINSIISNTISRYLQNKMLFFILSFIPVLGNVLAWTNHKHHLIREGDIVARFGGDEFVILLTDVKDKGDIKKVIERIFASFREGYDMNGTIVPIKASIGVSIYPDDGDDPETLLKKADLAMYDIKNTPERNSWRFYE